PHGFWVPGSGGPRDVVTTRVLTERDGKTVGELSDRETLRRGRRHGSLARIERRVIDGRRLLGGVDIQPFRLPSPAPPRRERTQSETVQFGFHQRALRYCRSETICWTSVGRS